MCAGLCLAHILFAITIRNDQTSIQRKQVRKIKGVNLILHAHVYTHIAPTCAHTDITHAHTY